MPVMITGRPKQLVLGVAVAGLVLAACGDSGGSGSETTPAPETTPWRTLAPLVEGGSGTTVPLDGGSVTYTIRSGDYANLIANKAGGDCSGTDVMDFNPEVEVLIPGRTLLIPQSCLGEGVTEETLNAEEDDTDSDATDDSGDSGDSGDAGDSGDEEDGYNTYVVVTGDYPFLIVEKTGCSYEELKAANGSRFTKLRPKRVLKVPKSCDTRTEDELSDSST